MHCFHQAASLRESILVIENVTRNMLFWPVSGRQATVLTEKGKLPGCTSCCVSLMLDTWNCFPVVPIYLIVRFILCGVVMAT